MKSFILSLILLIPFSISAQELLLKLHNPQVSGNQVTYDLSADNFREMIAMQYSLVYDTQVMTFVSVENIVVPFMSEGNFNTDEPGSIVNVWFDLNAEGVTFNNGTVLYQLVFEMVQDTFGTLCFSQEPIPSDFANTAGELMSFSIIDDCHAKPFQIIIHPAAIEDIAIAYGLTVNSIINTDEILISTAQDREIKFSLLNLDGKQMMVFSGKIYSAGQHVLDVEYNIIPGVYFLVAEIGKQKIPFKILIQ